MSRELKFKPEITRVKLNPEQVALICDCYSDGWRTILYCPSATTGATSGCPGDGRGPLPEPIGKAIWGSVWRTSNAASS